MNEPVNIRQVQSTEAPLLLQISRKTFFDAFAHQNDAADMEAYAAKSFTVDNIQSQLDHPHSQFFFAESRSGVLGYVKINYADAQTELNDSQGLEIERIYILAEHQRKGVGQQLLNYAIDKAVKEQLTFIWLGVWEHNDKALAFYKALGFAVFGKHSFMLGSDEQTDLLMRKEL